MSGFQIQTFLFVFPMVWAITIANAWPFAIQHSKSPGLVCFVLAQDWSWIFTEKNKDKIELSLKNDLGSLHISPDFKFFRISKGRISDPHCNEYLNNKNIGISSLVFDWSVVQMFGPSVSVCYSDHHPGYGLKILVFRPPFEYRTIRQSDSFFTIIILD